MPKPKYDWRLFAGLALLVVLLQVMYYLIVVSNFDALNSRGMFGDMFGGLTSLFSGLAFAGMISALVLQTKELGLQRHELELSRRAQENTALSQSGLVEKQLLTAQIQGLGFLLDSYIQISNVKQSMESKQRARAQASRYNLLLSELLEKSGLDMPESVSKNKQ